MRTGKPSPMIQQQLTIALSQLRLSYISMAKKTWVYYSADLLRAFAVSLVNKVKSNLNWLQIFCWATLRNNIQRHWSICGVIMEVYKLIIAYRFWNWKRTKAILKGSLFLTILEVGFILWDITNRPIKNTFCPELKCILE